MGSSTSLTSHAPGVGRVKIQDLEIFAIFRLCCRRGHPCFTNTCLVSLKCKLFIAWQSIFLFFRAQEPKAPVTYCDHALSGVRRPSVVRRPLDYLHFQLLLQNRLMDFDETWYGWSTQGPLQVLLFFGQIRPGADPGRGKIGHGGSPSSGNFFFRPEGYSNKLNA